jgi:hypothetical protein
MDPTTDPECQEADGWLRVSRQRSSTSKPAQAASAETDGQTDAAVADQCAQAQRSRADVRSVSALRVAAEAARVERRVSKHGRMMSRMLKDHERDVGLGSVRSEDQLGTPHSAPLMKGLKTGIGRHYQGTAHCSRNSARAASRSPR